MKENVTYIYSSQTDLVAFINRVKEIKSYWRVEKMETKKSETCGGKEQRKEIWKSW